MNFLQLANSFPGAKQMISKPINVVLVLFLALLRFFCSHARDTSFFKATFWAFLKPWRKGNWQNSPSDPWWTLWLPSARLPTDKTWTRQTMGIQVLFVFKEVLHFLSNADFLRQTHHHPKAWWVKTSHILKQQQLTNQPTHRHQPTSPRTSLWSQFFQAPTHRRSPQNIT